MQPTRALLERQTEHLIEVAIKDEALPIHADQIATHDGVEVLRAIGALQKGHIVSELSGRLEQAAEALDRHVRDRQQPTEDDAVTLPESGTVIGLQGALRGRQGRALRVVHQVQLETAALDAVAQPIELP